MPRHERVIVVFVASPSDLEAERNRLEEVVRELNLTWSRTLRVRVDLVRWETHGYPGLGDDAQDVLNRELPEDYDVFVGLMWGRYGTPTGRAGSGTEEEFSRALRKHRQNPATVKVMFYFKDAPLAPSAIDPVELGKVQQFKGSLGTEGALYWTFATLDEFERLVRLHLTRQVQDFLSESPQAVPAVPAPAAEAVVTVEEDEPGLLDLLDLAEEHFGALREATERLGAETVALGARMEERTQEANTAVAQAQGQLGRREARALIERVASNMDQYVARVRAELPLFRTALRAGADAVGRAAMMTADLAGEDRRQLREARDSLRTLEQVLSGASESVASFRATVQGLPRMTITLNRAKRETAAVLEEVVESLAGGRRVVVEARRAIDGLLGESPADA